MNAFPKWNGGGKAWFWKKRKKIGKKIGKKRKIKTGLKEKSVANPKNYRLGKEVKGMSKKKKQEKKKKKPKEEDW